MNRLVVVGVVAVFVLIGTTFVWWIGPLDTHPMIVRWFGPPASFLSEAYAGDEGRATFDHGAFDRLLSKHVVGVSVDYDGLLADKEALFAYTDSLATAPFEELGRDAKLAFLINAYNAFTLRLIVENLPLSSIKDIPDADRWDAKRWHVVGRTLSLSQLEHEELRAKFVEPRLHFAINCASVGCPPLRAEAYVPERLEEQLLAAAKIMHEDPRWLRLRTNSTLSYNTVELSRIYLWYAGDFEQVAGGQLAYAARFRPELSEGEWRIEWKPYDWSLNDVP